MMLQTIIERGLDENWSDNEMIDTLFHDFGYTLERIKAEHEGLYEFCRDNEYRKEMYPE